jgi:hypothetical protein
MSRRRVREKGFRRALRVEVVGPVLPGRWGGGRGEEVLAGLCKSGGQRGQVAVRQAGDELVENGGGSHGCGYCGVAGGVVACS